MPRYVKPSNNPVSEGVSRRFFAAIEALVSIKAITSLEGFCNENGLSAPRYRDMRLCYGVAPKPGYVARYKNLEVSAICSLVSNYPISARWLLTGRGKMLTTEK